MKRQKLQALRKTSGYTQNQMAEALDITSVFYGMIERGERNPTLELAKKISGRFNKTVDEIFFSDELYGEYRNDNSA